jgi:hypothetical protein
MASERFIEDCVIANCAELGIPDAVHIRRPTIGLGFGSADLLLISPKSPNRLVIVEAKRTKAPDADAKVIGQILLYRTAAHHFSLSGVKLMRQYATAHPSQANSTNPTTLKMMSGGVLKRTDAWKKLCAGRKLNPDHISLFIALDGPPSMKLQCTLEMLRVQYELSIGVVTVTESEKLRVWQTA